MSLARTPGAKDDNSTATVSAAIQVRLPRDFRADNKSSVQTTQLFRLICAILIKSPTSHAVELIFQIFQTAVTINATKFLYLMLRSAFDVTNNVLQGE